MLAHLTIYALDAEGPSTRFIYVQENGVEDGRPFLHGREAGGELGEKALDDGLYLHADDGVEGADHADIADEGGALGEDVSVGGGDVGVRADDGADAAVQVPSHRHFLAGGLWVG